ncbi:hypothetical protein 268TH004_38 [Bacillus phage 268TH004]|uniref:Uncharacterized protein n=1 Tax=Bacillus phage 268TH004 TaxID=2801523 RepID=A0A7T8C4K8_9CAUD|nr:hypothetical protein 268TH004_38 [Bacillus phage 268TH004]
MDALTEIRAEGLTSYYFKVAPLPVLSYGDIRKDMTELLKKYDYDEIYFGINYMTKFYGSGIKEPSKWNWMEISKFYELASLKRSTEKGVVEYDSKNTSGADHKSAWFGKGIDSDLFE